MEIEITETAEYNGDWTTDELSEVSLGDKRLDWRLLDSAKKLASRPSVSINRACDDWADTKATYRLFANQKTTEEKILQPHQSQTQARMAKYDRCLVLQDTSYLDYSHHPSKKGMGSIGTTKQNLTGMVMHSAIAITLEGLPLGTLSQQIWSRDEALNALTPQEKRKRPIEEKESYKWLKSLSQSVEYKPPDTQLITVGDSESDIFEFFNHASELETDLLVRAGQNRCVCEPEVGHLWSLLDKQPIAGQLAVHVNKRQNQPARDTTVSVRYMSLSLKPPQHLRATMGPIALYGILVQEIETSSDVEPICWLLLTTVPVCTFDEAAERIEWYCLRWQIEILHKILKSGCHIEDAQLDSDTRLKPLIALYTIIAWRLFWLTFLTRTDPDTPASAMLAPHELQALYWFHHKQPLPDSSCPTVHQATRWIAQLGGFLNRKRDGEPGVTVIWRGWQRLNDISDAYLTFHPPNTCG